MSDELKPCPFCGGPALFEGGEGAGYEVVCQHCGSRSGWGDYGYQAEAYWDKRTSNTLIEEQAARIAGLEDVLEEKRENINFLRARLSEAVKVLKEVIDAFDDGCCNEGIPDWDGLRMDRARTASLAFMAAVAEGE